MDMRSRAKSLVRRIDWAYLVLTVATLVLGWWNVHLIAGRKVLIRQVLANQPGLTGTPACQRGDIVPSVHVDGVASARSIVYDGSRRHLIFFFDPNCSVCVHESPQWTGVADSARRQGVEVHWISFAPAGETQKFLARAGSNADPVLLSDRALQRAYRVASLPQVLIVSPTGRVEWVHNGAMSEKVRESLRTALSGAAAVGGGDL